MCVCVRVYVYVSECASVYVSVCSRVLGSVYVSGCSRASRECISSHVLVCVSVWHCVCACVCQWL